MHAGHEDLGVGDGVSGGEDLGVLGVGQEGPRHEDILALWVARLLTAFNV